VLCVEVLFDTGSALSLTSCEPASSSALLLRRPSAPPAVEIVWLSFSLQEWARNKLVAIVFDFEQRIATSCLILCTK
jgi:hypothetical protein